jgi:lysophospholipase L1-like esterase
VSGSASFTALTTGIDYDLIASYAQTNGTTTTVSYSLYTVTGAGAALGTGTLLASWVATDTTAALQNAAGYNGYYISASAGTQIVKQFATYTDVAPSAATALVFAGPSTGISGTTGYNFVVTANGSLASSTTVTPSDGAAGGTFSPSSITLGAGNFSTAAFTYTPATGGVKSITGTATGLSANSASYAVAQAIAVTNAAFKFSPGNWKGDTGRGGSAYRQSWNNGAYFYFVWTASASPTASIMLPATSTSNRLSYYLNGVLTDNLAATGPVTLSGIKASAVNTLLVVLRSSTQASRWNNGTNTIQITGMSIDAASSAGNAPATLPWALIVGDSITEGISAANGSDSHILDYSFYCGQALQRLGYDYCISACGGNGFIVTGDGSDPGGDIPAYYRVTSGVYSVSSSRWNLIDQGVSVLDTNGQISAYGSTRTPPALIYINFGTNEYLQSKSVSDLQSSITQCLVALRAAAPLAPILVQIPFSLENLTRYPTTTYVAAIRAGVAAYQTAHPSDTKVMLLDFGVSFANTMQSSIYINADNIHPTTDGHALVAPMVMAGIAQALVQSTPAIHATGVRGGLR